MKELVLLALLLVISCSRMDNTHSTGANASAPKPSTTDGSTRNSAGNAAINPNNLYTYNIPVTINYDVNKNLVFEYFNIEQSEVKVTRGSYIVTNIIYTLKSVKDANINPNYLKGINYIKFTKNEGAACGYWWYNYIEINTANGCTYGYSQWSNKTKVFLHEANHNYCYITTGNQDIYHNGCFLDTPLTREYGQL